MRLFWFNLKRRISLIFRRVGHFFDYLNDGESVPGAWEHSGRVVL